VKYCRITHQTFVNPAIQATPKPTPNAKPNALKNDVVKRQVSANNSPAQENVQQRQKLKPSSNRPRIESTDGATTIDSSTITGNANISSALLKPDSIAPAPSNKPVIPKIEPDSSTKQWSNDGKYKNEFQELGLIGEGTFGQVFKALNLFDRQAYAVKKVQFKG